MNDGVLIGRIYESESGELRQITAIESNSDSVLISYNYKQNNEKVDLNNFSSSDVKVLMDKMFYYSSGRQLAENEIKNYVQLDIINSNGWLT